MVPIVCNVTMFLAWGITYVSLIHAWRRIEDLTERNEMLITTIEDIICVEKMDSKKKEGS